ncbi:MAG TPA: hypothetical protein VLI92_02485 [Candidatus Saccharimonadales bacterium]|nr:hypothetical protein [Candidatus Saccharimonadales bacterium]
MKRDLLSLIVFAFLIFSLSNSTSNASHICGTCPAGNTCGFDGQQCCETHGCNCSCTSNQCGTNSGWNAACPSQSLCCGSSCSDSSPSAPGLISPATGSYNKGPTVTFDWSDVSWGTACSNPNNTYKLYIDRVNAANLTNLVTTVGASTASWTVGLPYVTFYWQVEACNGARCTRSGVATFLVDTAPHGTISGPASACISVPSSNFVTSITDSENNIKQTQIFRRQRDATNTTWFTGSTWILVGSTTCAPSASCNTTASWTPVVGDLGDIYRVAVNGYDSIDDGQNIPAEAYTRCSGNTDNPANWSRCDTAAPQNDYLDVTVGQNAAPTAPVLVSPANGATNVALIPTYDWNASTSFGSTCGGIVQANSYTVQYKLFGAPSWTSSPNISSATTSWVSNVTLALNTKYEWRVGANNGFTTTWSQTASFWNFTTCNNVAPAVPVLVSPANGATGTTLTPTLTWNAASYGSVCANGPIAQNNRYNLEYRVFGTPTWTDVFTTATSYVMPTLAQSTQYEWRVGASNGPLTSWSSAWVFTTCGLTAPTAPTLRPTTFSGATATLTWNGILSTQWGGGCGALVKQYRVYIDDTVTIDGTVNDGSALTFSFAGVRGTTHPWWVATWNGSGQTLSAQGTFTIPALVTGYIWNSTGLTCAAGSPSANEIQPGAIQPSGITGKVTDISSVDHAITWNPNLYTTYSYQVDGIPLSASNQTICATVPSLNANFAWKLKCQNATQVADLGNGCSSVVINSGTPTINIGFDYSSIGWYTALDGDVIGNNVNLGVPQSGQVQGGFSPYLGAGKSTVIAGGTLAVADSAVPANNRVDVSGTYVTSAGTNTAAGWLNNFSFKEPTTTITGLCNSPAFPAVVLDPSKIYKINSACLNGILGGDVTYSLSADGVAVVYVWFSTDSTITFGKSGHFFHTADVNKKRKILFILENVSSSQPMNLVFSKDLNSGAITTATSSLIDAAFLVSGSVNFESSTPTLDNSVIVDGPIIAKGGISFNRDRGINNGYPSEVVKFDPLYVDKLSDQAKAAAAADNSGLSLLNVSWQLGE